MFDALRDELRGAQEVGERLQRRHGERDVEVERWRERVAQLLERWQAVLAQNDLRQRELEQLGRQLRYYRESADPLGAWLRDAKQRQEQIQALPLANSQAVREQLRQEKVGLGQGVWGRGRWGGPGGLGGPWPVLTTLRPPRRCWRKSRATGKRWRSASGSPSSTSTPSR